MTKAIFKYKVEYKDDNNKPIKKHFCNTTEIRQQLGIPRSSLFIMLDESKPDIEKFRKYKIYYYWINFDSLNLLSQRFFFRTW